MRRARSATTIGLALLTSCANDAARPEERATRPAFTIASPARGDMLQSGTLETSSITVAGEVCDPSDNIAGLTLNGIVIPVSGSSLCESFSVEVQSRWGLTTITGEARNSRGRTTRLARSFLRGPTYFPPADNADASARVPRGISAHLTDQVIDDRDPATPDDVAALTHRYLLLVDWNPLFEGIWYVHPDADNNGIIDRVIHVCPPLIDGNRSATGAHMIRNPSPQTRVLMASPTVETSVVPGFGLSTIVRLPSLDVPARIFAVIGGNCFVPDQSQTAFGWGWAEGITFSWSAGFRAQHLPDGRDTVVRFVTTISTNISASGLEDGGLHDQGYPVQNLPAAAVARLELAIQSTAEHVMQGQAPAALDLLIRGFVPRSPASVSAAFLPAIVGRPDTVGFSTALMRVTSAVQIHPTAVRPGPTAARGALRRDGEAPTAVTLQGSAFVTGVKDDVVNQSFWSAWRGGAFDGSGALAPQCQNAVPGVTLSSYALLPPVLMPGAGDSVTIGFGDLRLTGTVGAVSVELYASHSMAGTLGVGAPDALTITYDPAAEVHLEITALSDSTALDAMPAALAPYVACLTRTMGRLAIESVPLPVFLPPDVPGLSTTPWRPGNPSVARSGNYTMLRGSAP